jgi:hypothetical protein
MQENNLFEYAVIRVVPRVEREEFINVGVIVYCAKQKFLQSLFIIDKARLSAFAQDLNLKEVAANLDAFKRICAGDVNCGAIARLDQPSRFRWLTAMRSTVIQTSRVHPGFCNDAGEKLQLLYEQMVL